MTSVAWLITRASDLARDSCVSLRSSTLVAAFRHRLGYVSGGSDMTERGFHKQDHMSRPRAQDGIAEHPMKCHLHATLQILFDDKNIDFS